MDRDQRPLPLRFRAGPNRFAITPWSRRALFAIMSSVIETIERAQLRRVPSFSAGDRVKVHFQVIEGTRRRVQVFEGVVIKRQGHGARETFTVRKQSFGVGVERSFPLHSPKIERIELAARGDVRRAKLYYLRDRVGKRARVRERRYTGPEETVEPGLIHEATEATDADGMSAQETLGEAVEQSEADLAAESAGLDRDGGEGEPAAEAGESMPVADARQVDETGSADTAAAADGSSADGAAAQQETIAPSDAGGAEAGALTGDEPA